MSNQESKSKKELSDKELQQATGGADIEGGGGIGAADVNAVTTPGGWTDEEGVFHEGADAAAPAPDATMIPPYPDQPGKPY